MPGFVVGTLDAAPSLVEVDGAASIAKWACAEERLVHVGEQVGLGGLRGKAVEGELCGVGGSHGLLVGHLHGYGGGGGLDMFEEVRRSKVVASAAGVQDDGRGGT